MMAAVDVPRWADACYGLLLRVYPQAYRRRFADDMRRTFLSDLARVKARGSAAVLSFWIVTIAQAFWFGSTERRASSAGGPLFEPSRRPRMRWSLIGDMRYALRLLRRSPVFTLTSVLSLALGLAGSTVIFGLADALLFKSGPGLVEPERLVEIGRTTNGHGFDNTSAPVVRYLAEHTTTLERIAGTTFDPTPVSLGTADGSERVFGQLVSAGYFEVLGVRPALGRFFHADEDRNADSHPVTVLSHRFWQEHFGGEPDIIGRTIRLNNTTFDVVGVAEPEFEGATFVGTDLWVPIAMVGPIRGERGAVLLSSARAVWHTAVGRLKPGVSRAVAAEELNALLQAFRADNPQLPDSHGIAVAPLGRVPAPMRVPFTAFIGVLFALTFGLLAVACSNVGGMLLARATARRREIATRLAVGASRGQIVAQLITETVVLFLLSVVVAVPLAIWLMSLLQAALPALPVPLHLTLAIDVRSLLFVAGTALVTGVIFGVVPARHVFRSDLSSALYGQSGTSTRQRLRVRHALVVVQVALSLTMIITAALFVRTLLAAGSINPGFNVDRVDVVVLNTTLVRAEGQNGIALIDRVMERFRAIPGVEAVGYSRMIPLQGGGIGLGGVRLPEASEAALQLLNDADWNTVSADYFSVLEIPIVEGRAFSTADRDGQPLVAIVNETFARAAWPGESAVGRQFWQTGGGQDQGRPLQVVGVARDAKYRMVSEAQQPFIYVPAAQQPETEFSIFIKHAEGRRPGNELRRAVAQVEPGLPVLLMQSLDAATAIGLVPQQIAAAVAGGVGVLGVLLAALGLYGLMAFVVAQRSREIALRMALGATLGQMRSMIHAQAARLALIGAVLGLAAAAGIGTVVQRLSLLIDVRATDPGSFIGLSVVLALVLFIASDVPARRAARTNPAETLKAE